MQREIIYFVNDKHQKSIYRVSENQFQSKWGFYCIITSKPASSIADAAPQLMYRFIEQTMQPGPSVSLKCIAAGNPTPHFAWALDGFPLNHNER